MKWLTLLTGAFFLSCMQNNTIYQPKEGDLLFQDLDCGELCNAIKTVTYGVDSAEFSHIGLVYKINERWMVLEAISEGVVWTPLYDFFKRSVDSQNRPKIWVGRVQAPSDTLIAKVKSIIPQYLGQAYDDAFLMDNGKYYCSELIYELFKKANHGKEVFNLEPMTFKHPHTHDFLPVWKDYYHHLKMEIPEGEAGINPAGISRSDIVKIVLKLGEVSQKKGRD
ncbi:MAG: hypothetical protein JXR60_00685 [Bacteroidales bacterium]|nr:hypothetical protein [Bacteroidales bacterium]